MGNICTWLTNKRCYFITMSTMFKHVREIFDLPVLYVWNWALRHVEQFSQKWFEWLLVSLAISVNAVVSASLQLNSFLVNWSKVRGAFSYKHLICILYIYIYSGFHYTNNEINSNYRWIPYKDIPLPVLLLNTINFTLH
jgi:hypothetical protein